MSIDTFVYDPVVGDTAIPADYVSYSNSQTHHIAQEYSATFTKICTERSFEDLWAMAEAFGKAVTDIEFSYVVKDTLVYEIVIEYFMNVQFIEIARRYAKYYNLDLENTVYLPSETL